MSGSYNDHDPMTFKFYQPPRKGSTKNTVDFNWLRPFTAIEHEPTYFDNGNVGVSWQPELICRNEPFLYPTNRALAYRYRLTKVECYGLNVASTFTFHGFRSI